ncbi:hypothetical protein FGIG_01082 [Fasciola gigantica]|uniref:Uncharacterized protein n=1 Tax=Fasciola gigantica TaxID=46835 RepID=A0A504YWX2_FASGI|nr:hypothetical protein FGIG_01082 [Fasciola gigantica]
MFIASFCSQDGSSGLRMSQVPLPSVALTFRK